MLETCQKCNDGYVRFASWTLFTAGEKAARNLKGDADYQVTKTKCDTCGATKYTAKPLQTKTETQC